MGGARKQDCRGLGWNEKTGSMAVSCLGAVLVPWQKGCLRREADLGDLEADANYQR